MTDDPIGPRDFELIGDDIPYHLRSDASPLVRCDKCSRESFDHTRKNCGLTQPDGSRCAGMMESIDDPEMSSEMFHGLLAILNVLETAGYGLRQWQSYGRTNYPPQAASAERWIDDVDDLADSIREAIQRAHGEPVTIPQPPSPRLLCPKGCGTPTDGRPCWECMYGNYGMDAANSGGYR